MMLNAADIAAGEQRGTSLNPNRREIVPVSQPSTQTATPAGEPLQSMTVTFLLPLHEIHLKPNLPCGLNVLTLMAITAVLRNSHHPVEPVLVRKEDGHWLLVDGRHRYMAALIAGRESIACKEHAVAHGEDP